MPNTRFHNLLEARVKEVIEAETAQIIGGLPSDFPAYREAVGYIRGLNAALLLCDQIEEEHSK